MRHRSAVNHLLRRFRALPTTYTSAVLAARRSLMLSPNLKRPTGQARTIAFVTGGSCGWLAL